MEENFMISFRTDLALEAHEFYKEDKNKIDGVEAEEYSHGNIKVTHIRITNENGERLLDKPCGNYITIEVPQLIYSEEDYKSACHILSDELKKLYPISDSTSILTACLGNSDITADSVGVKVFKNLMVTRHMKKYIPEHIDESIRSVSAVAPGVIGTTGIETFDIIKGVTDRTSPDVIFAVDSLAARNVERISTTIQISDTGIEPGAGIGNFTHAISEKELGVKVIAIGVPTVVGSIAIINDSLDMMAEKNEFAKALANMPHRDKMNIIENSISDKIGSLMVTPKEIDRITDKVSKTIANGINLAVHRDLSFDDINGYID